MPDHARERRPAGSSRLPRREADREEAAGRLQADSGRRPGTAALAPTLVKPVVNALRILNHLGVSGRPETVTEIARALRINTSTCFNILRTLVAEGALAFDERSKGYSVGLGVVRLAERALSRDGKLTVIKPMLQRLADSHQITVTVWTLYGQDRIMLLSITQASADLQIQMRVGQRLPRCIGAFGQLVAYFSGLPESAIRDEFRKLRWDVAPTFESYWRDARQVAERGWAIDDGNFARGITSIAVPVFDGAGSLAHALVATMFQGQHGPDRIAAIASDMQAIGRDMEGIL